MSRAPVPIPVPVARPWVRAVVMFSGRTDLWWLRMLKPGFRHCFVALGGENCWVLLDPLAHYTEIAALALPAEFDLAGWYRAEGLIAVEARPRQPPAIAAPWRPYSCVEAVKRVLGLRAPGVVTPWQLYQMLVAEENNR